MLPTILAGLSWVQVSLSNTYIDSNAHEVRTAIGCSCGFDLFYGGTGKRLYASNLSPADEPPEVPQSFWSDVCELLQVQIVDKIVSFNNISEHL